MTTPQCIRLSPAELHVYKLCSNKSRSFGGNKIGEWGEVGWSFTFPLCKKDDNTVKCRPSPEHAVFMPWQTMPLSTVFWPSIFCPEITWYSTVHTTPCCHFYSKFKPYLHFRSKQRLYEVARVKKSPSFDYNLAARKKKNPLFTDHVNSHVFLQKATARPN